MLTEYDNLKEAQLVRGPSGNQNIPIAAVFKSKEWGSLLGESLTNIWLLWEDIATWDGKFSVKKCGEVLNRFQEQDELSRLPIGLTRIHDFWYVHKELMMKPLMFASNKVTQINLVLSATSLPLTWTTFVSYRMKHSLAFCPSRASSNSRWPIAGNGWRSFYLTQTLPTRIVRGCQ